MNYSVNSRQPSERQDRAALALWDRFVKISPEGPRRSITRFQVFKPTEDFDGMVVQIADQRPQWQLRLSNRNRIGREDFVFVHELGHLATIAGYVEPKANCSTFVDSDTNECAIDGSFAADFVQRFWPKASQDQAQRNQQSYFRANRDSFVDDYAATNPFEDMAETFAYYVCDYEVMGRVAKAKVSMFAADPVMAGYRADDTRNGVNCG